MFSHGSDFGDDRVARPFHTKDFGQLFEVLRRGFPYRENCVAKPAHAKGTQFVVKELYAQLTCEQWYILNDGQSDTPLLVLS